MEGTSEHTINQQATNLDPMPAPSNQSAADCPLGLACTSCPMPVSVLPEMLTLSETSALAAPEHSDRRPKEGAIPQQQMHSHRMLPSNDSALLKPPTPLGVVSVESFVGSTVGHESLPSWPVEHGREMAQRNNINIQPLNPLYPQMGQQQQQQQQQQSWMQVRPSQQGNMMVVPSQQHQHAPRTQCCTHACDVQPAAQGMIHPSQPVHASQPTDSTAALDSVAAVAMDLIKMSNWRCLWKQCSGMINHNESAQQHILKHVTDTVQQAQSCKMNPCTGRHLTPGQDHMNLHLANLGFEPGNNVRCSWEGTCTRRFSTPDQYRKHIETHIYVDTSRYDCGWCNCDSDGFISFHDLLDHALSAHLHTDKEHQAQVSNLDGNDAKSKSLHKCLWKNCGYKMEPAGTDQIAHLQGHLMQNHADWCTQLPERVLVCRWGSCRRFFTDKTKFAHHMCTHSGMKFFKCEELECEQEFTSESQRRAHVRRHHQKSFRCDICSSQGLEKGYSSGFNLREHIRIVHEKKDLVCETCNRKYKSHKAWSIHQRSCQELRPLDDSRLRTYQSMQPY